jgi:hypothetical protein
MTSNFLIEQSAAAKVVMNLLTCVTETSPERIEIWVIDNSCNSDGVNVPISYCYGRGILAGERADTFCIFKWAPQMINIQYDTCFIVVYIIMKPTTMKKK